PMNTSSNCNKKRRSHGATKRLREEIERDRFKLTRDPMGYSATLLHRLLSRAQNRFRAARPGSVLILVVALLVLMALIGTAYISTTRTDRYSRRQNVANTQIDMLLEGVVNMVTSAITRDIYGVDPALTPNLQYRPR